MSLSIEQDPAFWGQGLRECLIVGAGSDIAKELRTRLERDGWRVTTDMSARWDLAIFSRGTLEPIGRFVDCSLQDWEDSIVVNALQPLRDFRLIYHNRKMGATAVFFGGTNPTKDAPTYSAYAAAKALLREAVKNIAAEHNDIKAVMIDPGVVRTKIHDATLRAGKRAANYERVLDIVRGAEATVTHDAVYQKLRDAV